MRGILIQPAAEWDSYTEESIDELSEDDDINPAEEGFMKGYLDDDY